MDQIYINLFRAHVDQLKEKDDTVNHALKSHQPNIETDSFYTIATWLWLVQKQIRKNPDQMVTSIAAEPYIKYLIEQWSSAHPDIWGNKKDVYLSNVAMAYAALVETKHTRNESSLQQTITEIRDYVFNHLLSGGTALNGKEAKGVSIDQTLAVMPYGLFSPEDLIMVEATKKMMLNLQQADGILPFRGAEGTSQAATAMIALYYLEKYEKEKALRYAHLARIHPKKDELGVVILSLFDYYASQNDSGEKMIHDPLGNENVYLPQQTERYPHFPTIEDHIHFACQIVSEKKIKSVDIYLENETKEWQNTFKLHEKVKNETLLYQGKIPPLPSHGKYFYTFKAELHDGENLISDKYTLETWVKKNADSFTLFQINHDSLELGFGENHKLSFSLSENQMEMNIQQNTGKFNELQEKSAAISKGDYHIQVDTEAPAIILFYGKQELLRTHPLVHPLEWKEDIEGTIREFQIHWYAPQEEQYYGFGERYNAIEQRGEMIDCYVYNQYRDQGTRTYIPMPFYMTNKGYGCHIDTKMYTKFDLAFSLKDKCTWILEQDKNVQETAVKFYFGDYKKQVQAFTGEKGNPEMVPAWALGPWMSSNNWDRQSIVEDEIKATNHHGIPATVIVLEQWSDEATYYMFNDAIYELEEPGYIHKYDEMEFPEWGRWPDPKGMVNHIHEENLKLILWQIPIQKYLNKQQHPLKDQDETYMLEKGYVVKEADGQPYRIPENWFTNSLIMDFSHDEGRKWWFDKRQYLLDIGVDGFKTDGGEFVFGKNLQFANGQTGSEMRNQYPNDYVEAYYQFARQNGGITFSRAGYTGAQHFPAHWAGDERSTFDAFKRSLIAGLNAGLSGIVFWGWDLAGFNGDIPSAELFMRSSSMAAFCPIMQYHAESKAEFSQDRTPWNIASRTGEDRVIEVYRYFANVRMNLMPYIYQESEKACRNRVPLMRALMLDFPEDERVLGMYDEYLFGESLLVAPIIEEDSIRRKVYLPEGKWVSLWTEELHEGPAYIECQARVDEIPVFVRMNSALLLNVDESEALGSSVGNDISSYKQPLCKVYADASFEDTLTDHLGHVVNLKVEVSGEETMIKIDTDIENLKVEAIGNLSPVRMTIKPADNQKSEG
ncbi:TIM-barrel domain-containing protein [Jeotgalibacillus sp. JSM ZJ347]|uniref:glycoside hydrolase family 31 protein n=1 Tax=Jeotgalibacillus sp. JSM ZJ347 TaxID=3342117 RepID=UPI0035A8501B